MDNRNIYNLRESILEFDIGEVQLDQQYPYIYTLKNHETDKQRKAVMIRFVSNNESKEVKETLFVLMINDNTTTVSLYRRKSIKEIWSIIDVEKDIKQADMVLSKYQNKVNTEFS